MSILRALQKKQIEQMPVGEAEVKIEVSTNVVPFDKNSRRTNTPPEVFTDNNCKIGTPSSAFDGQSDSLIGTALPDLRSDITVGATSNAVGTTRVVEKRLPDFTVWDVEAERVEPRLVAITQPHSNYCEEYRSLRTHVLHRSQKQKLQSIVIASINPS